MRRPRVRTMLLVAVALAACALGAHAWRQSTRIGDLDVAASRLAVRAQRRLFTTDAWRRAGPSERGEMLADLARQHRLRGQRNTDIERLLGERSCYCDHEANPCYALELDGAEYWLVLYARGEKTPSEIVDVALREAPR